MKSLSTIIFISAVVGFLAGNSRQFFSPSPPLQSTDQEISDPANLPHNPFQLEAEAAPNSASNTEIQQLQQQINNLKEQVNKLTEIQHSALSQKPEAQPKKKKNYYRAISPNLKNLTSSGINKDVAQDLLRRISTQQYQRLNLQNLMQRADSGQRQQYRQQLRELSKNQISLRVELGEDKYDQYLFTSGQDNRVQVSSVMAGSPAQSSGFEADDIILRYDGLKILNWKDLRSATIQGEIGSYTNVDILREGETISLMVPRGTLGIQLDTAQVDPTN